MALTCEGTMTTGRVFSRAPQAMRELPPDLLPLRTGDGSLTLRSETLGEQYHSRHGAVVESTHVFITHGLHAVGKPHVDVLEVGLGTGLNMLLTWLRAIEGKVAVDYTALEPFPLEEAHLRSLDHPAQAGVPVLTEEYLRLMALPAGQETRAEGGFTFRRLAVPVQELEAEEVFDVVYFDAFGPRAQPEMWTAEVFRRTHRALRPGGLLVTYCAQGEARRQMRAGGLEVERWPGPPGKLEMTWAWKR